MDDKTMLEDAMELDGGYSFVDDGGGVEVLYKPSPNIINNEEVEEW